ncbi:MAG TPA: FG-GAP-like repeat-containing protein [Terriglobia bacterium]|nr:FG-GAP-like repeat-containing protein [Terriglobia bacterium]
MVRRCDLYRVRELRSSRLPLSFRKHVVCATFLLFALAIPISLRAVSNPVPYISTISPTAVAPGGSDYTLTVRGTGFINGQSAIFWNGAALPDPTTCTAASPPQLASCSVIVRAAMIATAITAGVTVVNPTPGGGTSNVVFFTVANSTPSVAFGNATGSPVSTGDHPESVAVGDFNGDGKLDLAVANYWSDNVTILMGKGDGTFAPTGQSPATGSNPLSVAVGDFNGDGKLDLAVANVLSENVTILLGNGDGTFAPTAQSPSASGYPSSVAVGDFNGDGKLDLVVATSSNNLTILLGNGDGTFTPTPQYPTTGNTPRSVAVGDFNGDGKLDLAVTNQGSNNVTVLLGNGDGTFTPTPQSPATGSNPYTVAVGDFNADGKMDLAVVNGGSNNNVTILLGNGDGTFIATAQSPATGRDPYSVEVGDFNGDGKLDLAVSDLSNYVTILLGNGDGTFAPTAQSPATGSNPYFLAVGDFDSDGRLDLAASNINDNTVSILLQVPFVITSPSSLTFSNQAIGTTSRAQTVTLTNTGSLDLTISSIVSSGDFTQTNNCPVSPATLAANANCTINPTFTPSAAGTRTGSVIITDNAPGSPQSVSLSGSGIAPVGAVSPARLTFASQPLGSTSAPQTVTLSTTSILSIISITASGSFAQTNTCGASVPAGGNCTISLTFAPTGPGPSAGSLTITDDASNSPQTVALSGTGTGPVVGLSPSGLSFGTQSSISQAVTLTNNGNLPLTFTSIVATGDFAQTNTCGGSAAAGANCAITVTFTPTATGTRTGTITIADNASNSPQTVALSGTGTGPVVGLSPSSLSFTNQLLGTTSNSQSVTVYNTGNMALTVSRMAATGDFAQTNTCGSSVAAGANCTIAVTFTPAATGTRTGTIIIADNAGDSPETLNLGGTGIAPAVTPSTAILSFPSQFVGTSGLPQNVTVLNSGTAPLNISNVAASSSFGDSVGCNSPIPVGSICSISVFFDPATSGSVSGTLTITDDAPGSPHTVALSGTGQDFSLAAAASSSPTANIAQGLTASYKLSLAPAGGFNRPVAFSCTGAPLKSACTVSPAVVTLSPTSATSVLVTVTTTASSLGLPQGASRPTLPSPPPFIAWWVAAALVGVLIVFTRRARGRLPLRVAFGTGVLLVAMLGALSMPGCGGGVMPTAVIHDAGTPSGTYTLNVTGTFSSGDTTLSHSVQLTLTVH